MITEEQRQRRAKGIFASDVARIMTGNGVTVALEKMGELEPEDLDNVPTVMLGNVLEGPVLDAYEAFNPLVTLDRSPDTMLAFNQPWLGCHLDALGFHKNGYNVVVEAKAFSAFNRAEWGEAGTDEVPLDRMWQCMAQMAVTGAIRADIPICFVNEAALVQFLTKGTVPIEVYTIERNEELINRIFHECGALWEGVLNRELPTPVKIGDARLIYKQDNGNAIAADDDVIEWMNAFNRARDDEKAAEVLKGIASDRVQRFMGEASELIGAGKILATWKKAKDSQKFDTDAFAKDHPDLYKQYLKTTQGSRRFLGK